MRLRSFSRGFFTAVLLALVANLAFLVVNHQAAQDVQEAFDTRDRTLDLVRELVRENDQLAQLVQSFTTTGQTRYLADYYRILAQRDGVNPEPADNAPARRPGLIERMRALDFSGAELAAAREALAAAAAMQEVEKVAFAATQGLYDPQSHDFVSEGTPDHTLAVELVHAESYERQRSALQDAVDRLGQLTRKRTEGEVERLRQRLDRASVIATVLNVLLLPLMIAALLVLRRRVLVPIGQLGEVARRFTEGDLHLRTALDRSRVHELGLLAQALDEMAGAIEGDLARRDAQQRELQAARDEAESATLAKSRFLANMSHEIRTPMNAIMGMTHLALQTPLSAEQRDYLNKAHGASNMLLGLINDVLDFSKIEAGRMSIEAAPFSIEEVVSQAVELVRQPAQAKEIELLCEFADASLLANRGTLRGDALRVQLSLIHI